MKNNKGNGERILGLVDNLLSRGFSILYPLRPAGRRRKPLHDRACLSYVIPYHMRHDHRSVAACASCLLRVSEKCRQDDRVFAWRIFSRVVTVRSLPLSPYPSPGPLRVLRRWGDKGRGNTRIILSFPIFGPEIINYILNKYSFSIMLFLVQRDMHFINYWNSFVD